MLQLVVNGYFVYRNVLYAGSRHLMQVTQKKLITNPAESCIVTLYVLRTLLIEMNCVSVLIR